MDVNDSSLQRSVIDKRPDGLSASQALPPPLERAFRGSRVSVKSTARLR